MIDDSEDSIDNRLEAWGIALKNQGDAAVQRLADEIALGVFVMRQSQRACEAALDATDKLREEIHKRDQMILALVYMEGGAASIPKQVSKQVKRMFYGVQVQKNGDKTISISEKKASR